MRIENLGFVERLNREMAELNRVQQLQQEAEAKAKFAASIDKIKKTKPLTEQITELMQTLPPALRDRPWMMAEFVSRLNGRYRERPHAQHVGEALRQLGWRRDRLWGKGGEGRRVWINN